MPAAVLEIMGRARRAPRPAAAAATGTGGLGGGDLARDWTALRTGALPAEGKGGVAFVVLLWLVLLLAAGLVSVLRCMKECTSVELVVELLPVPRLGWGGGFLPPSLPTRLMAPVLLLPLLPDAVEAPTVELTLATLQNMPVCALFRSSCPPG